MNEIVSPTIARRIARAFIGDRANWDCESPGPQLRISKGVRRLWLSETIPLYEFGIETAEGKQSGYVLIAGSTDFTPIVQYCVTGGGFVSTLRSDLSHFLRSSAFASSKLTGKVKLAKFFYLSPFDVVAEIARGQGNYLYVRVPNIEFRETKERLSLKQNRSGQSFRDRWEYYLRPSDIPLPFDCKVLSWHAPKRYQQTCRPGVGGNQTQCGGNCVSGCSAVAWATLAGSFMSYAEFSNIEVDGPHFGIEWPTLEYWKPADPIVDSVIWAAHGYLPTSCDGKTKTTDLPTGAWIFHRYGYDCTFGLQPADVMFARALIRGGFTFILSAQSHWTGTAEVDGHSVVVYGYNTSNFKDHVLICLSWGTNYDDTWISMSQLSESCACYLSSHRPYPVVGGEVSTGSPDRQSPLPFAYSSDNDQSG
ncbi:hypothetical protein E3H11_10485 [Bradyrhizobium brasilense]|uniref:hypothetical protein n=1 Tax=Bradyrhizobium brasilense TaxID=1419277 RepID=UPI001456FF78|nr:hypothetical protein [Bradyrhizobium brasilense]NLS69339.1 hypothetical protein [Bradyrhizobium brasilense]